MKRPDGSLVWDILLTPIFTVLVVVVVTAIKILMLPMVIFRGFRGR